ncbi:hypothetical protein [Serratia fonticola]|uniref:hypothetical protein n=1 Tax=Serratia fonticola TaxID=47917 RepID=UPI000465676D|nr:hypothetical protein [Serratia fonticola]CAI0972519.1 Uncharacterised protein [Serratia fonticola]
MLLLNNRSGKFIGLLALALIAAALLFNLLMHKFFVTERGPKVSCAAFFLAKNEFRTKGVMSLHIDGVSRGRMHISATVRDDMGVVKYHLLRNVNFEYRYEGNGYIALQLMDVNNIANDNMPNELFNQSIFDFSVKTRQLRITEVGDGYLLWNAFSPVMMCVRST